MKKVIAMIRTSTSSQSIEDQHNEMVEFLKLEGYKEKEIEWIEGQGASAAKVDDKYQDMIARIKQMIETTPSIQALAVWHLNRAFRTEDSYVDLKKFLISHKVNLLCKNPYLKLLTPTGEVDKGMELAAGLLAILAKQDQEERAEKFKRAKTANSEKGKFNGGTPKYGYCVGDDGYVVENPVESRVVTQIFELYATGKYSTFTLAKELAELGIQREDGKRINNHTLTRMLCDTAYIGYTDNDRKRSHRKFPPIISMELWNKVKEVREDKFKNLPRTGHIYIGNKILKCPECGGNLHRDKVHYMCWKHNSHSIAANNGYRCGYKLTPPSVPTESILWKIASELHIRHLVSISESDINKYNDRLAVSNKKLANVQTKIEALERKKNKVIDAYIDDLITKPQRDEKLANIANEQKDMKARFLTIKDEVKNIEHILAKLNDRESYVQSIGDIVIEAYQNKDMQTMYDICHTYIQSCTMVRTQFGKPDPRAKRPNALEYTIKTYDGDTYKVLHIPCAKSDIKYYAWDGRKYSPMFLDEIK